MVAEFKGSNRRKSFDGIFNVIITSNSRLRAKLEGDTRHGAEGFTSYVSEAQGLASESVIFTWPLSVIMDRASLISSSEEQTCS